MANQSASGNSGSSAIFHVSMDDDGKLGLKPEVLTGMYQWIDSRAKELAPENLRSQLRITQDGRVKTKYNIAVSDSMTPHLVAAIQQKLEGNSSIGLRTYFQKLQEQLMAQMFGDFSQPTQFNIRYEGKLI